MQAIAQLFNRLPKQSRLIFQTCLYGIGAGLAAVFFQLGINWFYRLGILSLSKHSSWVFLCGSFGVIVGSSLVTGWLLTRFCPEASGSGVPQLKLAFWKDFGMVPFRVIWVKFIAGVVSIGGGSSLGREGPSVQLAGAVSSNLAGLTGEAKQSRRTAAAAGAAAGLAAAFNTPLAATTFVLEEIIGDLNSRLLGSVLLASVLGALVVHGIIGKNPSFALTGVDAPSWIGYVLTPFVAALASLVGVYFQRTGLGLRFRVKQHHPVPLWLMPAIGGSITWVLGAAVFLGTGHLGVFSLGYGDLSSALSGDVGWRIAVVLLLTKFAATSICYGCGGCGGIFSPTLFFGGMVGVAVAGVIGLEIPITRPDMITLAVVGMSACLGAVVGAPVTGILIVFEMTHEFSLVPALMLGALVSQMIRRKMNRENFYDALLTQDGNHVDRMRPPRDLQSWNHLPVSAIANYHPVTAEDITPKGLQALLKHPYEKFIVVKNDRLEGILTRLEIETALRSNRTPRIEPAVTCLRNDTVGDLQKRLVESSTQLVVLLSEPQGKVLGLITLHDLLRAQNAMAEILEKD
jgi:CIC family chloride channel protein